MTKWYCVTGGMEVEEVNVVRETPHYLVLQGWAGHPGRKELKRSRFQRYFPTRREAYDFLIKRKTDKLAYDRQAVKDTAAELARLRRKRKQECGA